MAEVLALGETARRETGGAFDVELPGPDSRPRLDPSGVVKGWAVERDTGRSPDLHRSGRRLRHGPSGSASYRPGHRRPPVGIASVTVVTQSLTWADVDATAASVQGRNAAAWLRTRPGCTGFIVWDDGTTTAVQPHHRPGYVEPRTSITG